MLRSLIHYGKTHVAVVLGGAVATAVLTGALLVGDSVRLSLRDLALERLGRIDEALLAERFFQEALAGDGPAAPVILLRGTVAAGDARATGVAVHGVDGRFAALFPGGEEILDLSRRPDQLFPSVALSRSVQEELQIEIGDPVILSFPIGDDVPRDSVLGRRDREHVLGRVRATLTSVLPDRGPGRFSISARQGIARNAYLDLADLQRALEQEGRVNALVSPGALGADDLRADLSLDDLGLFLEDRGEYVSVESREFVLRDPAVAVIREAAREIGAATRPFQTYLANEIRRGERAVPYSMITAIDPGPASLAWLRREDGSPAPPIGDDEILLNRWAADDLSARTGDTIEIEYYVVGEHERLRTETSSFRLAGVVALDGPAADPGLTPSYPGIADSPDMSSWDPPFPVELSKIRPKDEAYWDAHRGTPKAFLAGSAGRRLWANRYGTVTGIQVPGQDTARRLEQEILRTADLETFGFRRLPLRAESQEASKGSTDFSMLFVSFSFFLILSAALLVSLLFRLGVEQRAAEVGLLLAVGFSPGSVRRRFLGEASALALVGTALGIAGGVGYAALMMVGLRTWWRPAVGTSMLSLHVEPASLALGGTISFLVVLGSVTGTIRRLGRMPAIALLSGALRSGAPVRGRAIGKRLAAWGGLAGALVLLVLAAVAGLGSSVGVFFGAGALLLISGLAFFSLWCRRPRRSRPVGSGRGALAAMAARNTAASPGRSILSVAMVASACFVIVAAAANRRDFRRDAGAGVGGYALIAESDVPLFQSLETTAGRFELGLPPEADDLLAGVTVTPFRLRPGDDASCLNLYRPQRPRVLGVPRSQIERGGFAFSATIEPTDEPWTLLERDLGPGVVPAFADESSAQWILHVGLGEDVVMQDEAGQEVRLRLVGLLSHSLFRSDVLISGEAFLRHFPSRGGHSVFLIDAGDRDPAQLSRFLEANLAPFGFDVSSTADRLAAFEEVQNTYISTFVVLGGLGLLLGTVGLGVIMVRNVLERRSELATMRAFGFRRVRLGLLVLAENAVLLLLGVGLGAGSALVAVAPHLASSGADIPWASVGATLAGVLAIGLLSSVGAVRDVLTTPLLPALKSE